MAKKIIGEELIKAHPYERKAAGDKMPLMLAEGLPEIQAVKTVRFKDKVSGSAKIYKMSKE